MSNVTALQTAPTKQPKSITLDMADRFGMEPAAFEQTLRATVFPNAGSKEAFAAFLLVAKQYNLNPVLKEIYAFPAKGGGIVPIVSIDGWMNLINSHSAFDGMDFDEARDDEGALVSITCTIHRKDRAHPTRVTEYLSECIRNTDPWKMKNRMLRHKSAIQCARYAFGFAGIYDEDEGAKIAEVVPARLALTPPAPPAPPPPVEIHSEAADDITLDDEAYCGPRIIEEFAGAAKAATDETKLNEAYDNFVTPYSSDLFKMDQEQVDKIYRDRLAEISE
jgi:phage recombination protein Bet